MNTSDVLNRAADLIEERGWTGDGEGWPTQDVAEDAPLCVEGGFFAAIGRRYETADDAEAVRACPAYRAVQDYLDFYQPLWWWNDEADRDASEVIEVLRAAAVVEAARESSPALVGASA